MVEQQFQIDRGGSTVTLDEAQQQELQELVQSSLEKGGDTIVFYGRDPAIQKAGGFIIAEAKRKQFIGFETTLGSGVSRQEALKEFKQQQIEEKVAQRVGIPSRESLKQEQQTKIARQIESVGGRVLIRKGEVVGAEIEGKSFSIKELRKGLTIRKQVKEQGFSEGTPIEKKEDKLSKLKQRGFKPITQVELEKAEKVGGILRKINPIDLGTKAFTKSALFLEKKTGLKDPIRIQQSTIREIGTFAFFSPFMGTRVELGKKLFVKPKVTVVGETQTVLPSGNIQTRTLAVIERGGRTTEGIRFPTVKKVIQVIEPKREFAFTVSESTVKQVGKKITISETVGAGGIIKKGFEFPTGREVTKIGDRFLGIERGLSYNIGRRDFVQVSKGLFQEGKIGAKPVAFKTVGTGKRIGDVTLFAGKLQTEAGLETLYRGILTKPKVTKDIGGVVSSAGGTVTRTVPKTALKLASEQSQKIIVGGIQPAKTFVTPASKIGSIVSLAKPTQVSPTKTITQPTQENKIRTDTKIIPAIRTQQITRTGTRLKLSTATQQKLESGQKTQLTQKIVTQTKQDTQQRVATQQKIVQRTQQDYGRFGIVTTIVPPSQKKPKIPFRIKTIPSTPTPRGAFGVQVRRRGKFQSIGTGLSLGQAITLGQQRVGTTLGATFRITGSGLPKGIRTPVGFRRKTTKEGTLFIERRGLRLSTKGEVGEIGVAKRQRGTKKKSRRKKK